MTGLPVFLFIFKLLVYERELLSSYLPFPLLRLLSLADAMEVLLFFVTALFSFFNLSAAAFSSLDLRLEESG